MSYYYNCENCHLVVYFTCKRLSDTMYYQNIRPFCQQMLVTRMHFGGKRTVRGSSRLSGGSASVHAGITPGSRHPPESTPQTRHPPGPPGQGTSQEQTAPGPGTPQEQTPQTRTLETCCKAFWDTTCKACWDTTPPPCGHTHTCKNITFATSLRTINKLVSFKV